MSFDDLGLSFLSEVFDLVSHLTDQRIDWRSSMREFTRRKYPPEAFRGIITTLHIDHRDTEEDRPEREHLDNCAICQDRLDVTERSLFIPDCGHMLHYDCAKAHMHRSRICPLCRARYILKNE